MSEFWLYVKLGFTHVLDWQAYDHILFLIVLTISYTFDSWKKVLVLVTLFTFGHSMSLLLATYDVVSVNSNLVEFLIPVTILATAFVNIITAVKNRIDKQSPITYAATVFFGLIHGFGFSGFFNTISSNTQAKVLPLLEFALGIEGAQLTVVLVVLVVSFIVQTFFRFSKRDWIIIISSVVIGLVIPMLVANKIW